MRGRKPKPSHLKLVTGNPGKRPINQREPEPPRSRPSAPAHISVKAREYWGFVVGELDRMGVVTSIDALAIEMLCEAYADYQEASQTIIEFGSKYYETVNATGGIMYRSHPAVAVRVDADRRIKGWCAEFGMTAAARTRIQTGGKQKEHDPADDYF
jgi:P27 family predicted phage terminase small subunit